MFNFRTWLIEGGIVLIACFLFSSKKNLCVHSPNKKIGLHQEENDQKTPNDPQIFSVIDTYLKRLEYDRLEKL